MTDLLEWWHDGNTHIGTAKDLVSELTYASYRHARDTNPELSVEGWSCIYGEAVSRLEARYQQEHKEAT